MYLKFVSAYICAFICANQFNLSSGQNEAPLISVKQGLIRGITESSLNGREFYSYMGIPYAEPPLGKLRFKDPIAKEKWEGTLNATEIPEFCLQNFPIGSDFEAEETTPTPLGKEDCLKLNVFTPVVNSEKKLPVMFYIHGGAFIIGSTKYSEPYVLMDRDVVLVVIQYRLGIFGFLSTEDSEMPGNMGLKDQQMALKWINENIEAFGGDVNNITIFGQSAGAASVHYQMLSPGSKGLFQRAILMSGSSLCPWASNKGHRKFAVEIGQQFNCSLDLGTENYLQCMQNADPINLTTASKLKVFGFYPIYVLPRIDGVFIEEAPEVLMKNGKYNKVDVVAGLTKDEGATILLGNNWHSKTVNENFEELGPNFLYFFEEENRLELTKQIYKHYLQREDFTLTETDWKEVVEMINDRMYRVCHDAVVNFYAADPDVKLYLYQLDHFGQLFFGSYFEELKDFDRKNTTMHGDDLIYLFNSGKLAEKLVNEGDLKLREIYLDLWTNFSRTGNPIPSGYEFTWPEATPESLQYLSLTPSPVLKDYNFEQKQFWSSLNTTQNLLLGNVS